MLFRFNQVIVWLFGNFALDTKVFDKHGKIITQKTYGGSVNFASQTIQRFFTHNHIVNRIFSIGIPPFLVNQDKILFDNRFTKNDIIERSKLEYFTHFILDYSSATRKLMLEHLPTDRITFSGISTSLEHPQIAFITPIFNEVSEQLAIDLKTFFSDVFIACDPQGWCREINKDNNVIKIKEWNPSEDFLKAIAVLKLSVEDITTNYFGKELGGFLDRIFQNDVILIITAGKSGTISFFPNYQNSSLDCFFTPIFQVTEIIDTTGAGDVWLAAFTLNYHQTKDIIQSLAMATIISSLKIQTEGVDFKYIDQNALNEQISRHRNFIEKVSVKEGLSRILKIT